MASAAAATYTGVSADDLAAVKASLLELYEKTPCMPCENESSPLPARRGLVRPALSTPFDPAVMIRLAWHDAGEF